MIEGYGRIIGQVPANLAQASVEDLAADIRSFPTDFRAFWVNRLLNNLNDGTEAYRRELRKVRTEINHLLGEQLS